MRNDRPIFRRAIEVSILLHLLLVFIVVPRARDVWPTTLSSSPLFAAEEPEDSVEPPLEFEFVDLAEEREEKPTSDFAPLSDLDRRAHGGEGEELSNRPATTGNTYQLVQSEGGDVLNRGAPPRQLVPPSPQEQVPEPEEEPREEQPEDTQVEPEPEGAGEQVVEPESQRPAIRLPPSDAWRLPPTGGGLLEAPNRDGGAVDSGGLSFDTQWYDWGPYAKRMLAKIRRYWRVPEIAMMGVSGVVQIRYFIERDGSVTGLQIISESGKPPMDFAARDAIAHASPFDQLPAGLTGVDREGVTITFYYNMDAPDRRR